MKRRVNSDPFRLEQKTPRSASWYGMESLMTSSHDNLWRASFFLGQPTAEVGYMVRSIRLIPGLRKSRTAAAATAATPT